MGWNSWICYGTSVTEKEVIATAEVMSSDLLSYGWEYITIDAGWYAPGMVTLEQYEDPHPNQLIDAYGRLIVDPEKYPSAASGDGFRPLSDYLHSRGLKFGIHIMRGIPIQAYEKDSPIKGSRYSAKDIADTVNVCKWYHGFYGIDMTKPGAVDYYDSIFDLYREWGVDYVKADDLLSPVYAREDIEAISRAATRNGIVLSLSPGPAPIRQAEHLRNVSALWRISDDFWDNWESLKKQFPLCAEWVSFSGDGHYPDADMLPVGNMAVRAMRGSPRKTNFTEDEQYTLLTLWAMSRSPLILGCVLPEMDDFTRRLICNKEVIDIDQRSSGNAQIYSDDSIVIWKASMGLSEYVAVFNISDMDLEYRFETSLCNRPCETDLKEIWTQCIYLLEEGSCILDIRPHGVKLLKIN